MTEYRYSYHRRKEMKNPFKKASSTAPAPAPAWFIHIEYVSDTMIKSQHTGMSVEHALRMLKVVVQDYERQVEEKGHEHA
jgi:hypothetical protein